MKDLRDGFLVNLEQQNGVQLILKETISHSSSISCISDQEQRHPKHHVCATFSSAAFGLSAEIWVRLSWNVSFYMPGHMSVIVDYNYKCWPGTVFYWTDLSSYFPLYFQMCHKHDVINWFSSRVQTFGAIITAPATHFWHKLLDQWFPKYKENGQENTNVSIEKEGILLILDPNDLHASDWLHTKINFGTDNQQQ